MRESSRGSGTGGSRSSSKASKASGVSGTSSVPDEWEIISGGAHDIKSVEQSESRRVEASVVVAEDEADEAWDEARRVARVTRLYSNSSNV